MQACKKTTEVIKRDIINQATKQMDYVLIGTETDKQPCALLATQL